MGNLFSQPLILGRKVRFDLTLTFWKNDQDGGHDVHYGNRRRIGSIVKSKDFKDIWNYVFSLSHKKLRHRISFIGLQKDGRLRIDVTYYGKPTSMTLSDLQEYVKEGLWKASNQGEIPITQDIFMKLNLSSISQ